MKLQKKIWIKQTKQLAVKNSSLTTLANEILEAKKEFGFLLRWDLIRMYHAVGEILVSHRDTVDLNKLSGLVEISKRNLYRSIQFYNKYPDLDRVPEGKAISWRRLINKYLPVHKEKEECDHEFIEVCKKCGIRKK